MSSFTVLHTCGHEATHTCEGDPAQRLALLRTLPCETCNRALRAAAAAALREEWGLPELVGTPEDVTWAETIRMKAMEKNHAYYQQLLAERPFEEQPELLAATLTAAEYALHELQSCRDAAWWVAQREESLDHVKYRVAEALRPLLHSQGS